MDQNPQHVIGLLAIAICALPLGMSEPAFAQKAFAGCLPVSERTSEIGCWIRASEFLGQSSPASGVLASGQILYSGFLAEKVKEPKRRKASRWGKKAVNVIVPEGQPMKLSVTGTEQRRSPVLVLHDAWQPWMIRASD